jgi:hypothetical protein
MVGRSERSPQPEIAGAETNSLQDVKRRRRRRLRDLGCNRLNRRAFDCAHFHGQKIIVAVACVLQQQKKPGAMAGF